MSLADYEPELHTVTFKGGSFTVSGLSLEHLTKLVRGNMPALQEAYRLWENNGQQAEIGFVLLLHELPDLCATIIALGAGDESLSNVALKLPVPLQIESLEAIFRLTFEEAGGLKNFLALWHRLLGLFQKEKPQGATNA